MTPYPTYLSQLVAKAHQADLLREAEAQRRAALTAAPTVLSRMGARIRRALAGIQPSRPEAIEPATAEAVAPTRTA